MSELPALPRPAAVTPLGVLVEDAFSSDGALARAVEGYEPRVGQRDMAHAVAECVEHGGTLLAEAGTGTGKTLAYLIPAILSGHRVIVSTGTKNLQEQIYFKDLPALQRALDVRFTAALMKGRGNYLCLHRWESVRDNPGGPDRQVFLPIIDDWARRTRTGDRAELRDLPEDLSLWRDLSADAETCLGSDCPRYDDCFVTRMRQQAAEADVVIVNHHLLCADAAVRHGDFGEVIPAAPTLVVDEAHQLEDVATQYFGVSVSSARLEDLLRDVEREVAATMVARLQATRVAEQARQVFWMLRDPAAAERAAGAVEVVREFELRSDVRASKTRYTAETLAPIRESVQALVGALDGLAGALASPGDGRTIDESVAALARRAEEIRDDLRFLVRADDLDFVYFLEIRGRGVLLRAAPIHVARIARQTLFDRMRSVVLTSATMTVDGSFNYIRHRLGVESAVQLRVSSEFDYARQALVYLPRRLPAPSAPTFAAAAGREVLEILRRSRGRAFVLFTSYAMLRSVQRQVESALPYPILVQGSAPRSSLIEQFRSTPHAVLLATSSFWQGVDVVGEALSCVIIDKLPFASPGDPITAARIEAIAARGGDPFAEYQIPLAILTLQQGLGRLIRHRGDRGVLAILDPRLRTARYGERFLASLPPAPQTHDLAAIERFFD